MKISKPKIVCLCGSTRFEHEFWFNNLKETLKGNIVLTTGVNLKHLESLETATQLAFELGIARTKEVKEIVEKVKKELDELHLHKIDLADEVLVLNVGGYIGESTARELDYARGKGKSIRFLEPKAGSH